MKAALVIIDKTRLKLTGLVLFICIRSHQAKLIKVCKQPPGVDISQAVPHVQVGEGSQKHLKATKQSEKEKAQAICCASITILCCKE